MCFLRPCGCDDLKVRFLAVGAGCGAIGGGVIGVSRVDFVTLSLARARARARGGATGWLRESLWGQWLWGQVAGFG